MPVRDKKDEKTEFISPVKILKDLKLREGDRIVDYGAGPGHWSIPAAKLVGRKGSVLAVDNNIDILEILRGKASIQGLENIEIQEVNLEKEQVESEELADLIIVANILHLISNKEKFMEKATDLVKDSGKILVVDWHIENKMFGPANKLRLKEEQVMTICENIGLEFICTVNAGWHHFGMIFKKKGK